MAKKNDIRLGQLLVQKQWCTLCQVNEALLTQARLRGKNENRPLGQILIDLGVMDGETLRVVLAELGALSLRCPVCRVDYPMDAYQRGSVHLCERCQEPLVLSDPESSAQANQALLEEGCRASDPAESTSRTSIPHTTPAPSGIRDGSARPAKESSPAGDNRKVERDDCIGRVLGGCQILERVGQGGMGVVYKAKQLNLGRIVAVKILAADLARDAVFVRRFLQEARSAAQLSHGNIVHINDVGEYQGVYYFAMEYVDGSNLREVLKECERLAIPRALEILTQVCHALRHAHSRGIIHRDIKPENIMITEDGVVKLADLGLAKRMASETAAGLTHAGSILGTPFYMAPEQAKDFSKVDSRSDIYSLGITLYKMLTGKVPYDGRSPIEVMIKAIDGRRAPIRSLREEVPLELERIVDKMMHKAPEKRYQDVDSLLEDLARVQVLATA